jgi:cellulose 1,4-beta-cellobiosidase
VTVTATAPSAPSTLKATAGVGSVSLTWQANGGTPPLTYNVKRSTVTSGPFTTIASGITTTSYTDTDVMSGKKYYYVVTATNCKGESAKSPQASATPQ